MAVSKLYGIKRASDVKVFGLLSKKMVLDLDYANKFELELKEDNKTYAMKDGITKAIAFDGEKSGTIKIGSDLASGSLLAFVNRSELLSTATTIYMDEKVVLTADDQVVTPAETVVTYLGAYKYGSDGSMIGELTTATRNDADGKITLTGAKKGDIIKIQYTVSKEALHFKVTGNNTVTEDYKIVANTIAKELEAGAKKPFQIICYKCSPNSSLTLSYDGSKVSSFEFSLDLLVDDADNMVDYIEIPQAGDAVTGTPISNLIAMAGNTQATLGFSPITDATLSSVKVQYSTDSGSTWSDVVIGGSSSVRIASAIISTTSQITVLGLTNSTVYEFRINVTSGKNSGISNVVSVTPTA